MITLSVIDLKTWLLPDKYVAAFGLTGLVFHASQDFILLSVEGLILGAVAGGGMLLIVRALGNWHYKQESLGLGDVKLMAASGLWLGVEGVVLAITIGAFAGLLHGLGIAATRAFKTRSKIALAGLTLPAGPGFCVGILVMQLWFFSFIVQRAFE